MIKPLHVLIVKNAAQKEIFEQELQGQLSDGNWENEDTDSRLWDCKVIVSNDGEVGISFKPRNPVDFNDYDMIEVVGDRMIRYAQKVDPSYNLEKLVVDLEDLTKIVFGEEEK